MKPNSNILWQNWLVPQSAWDDVRSTIRYIVETSLPSIERAIRDPDPLVSLILGKVFSAASNMERGLLTRIGQRAHFIVKPFFYDCKILDGFWHMLCRRFTNEGDEYIFTVKVVLGPKTFNSTMKKRVEQESETLQNPIVLTLSGRRSTPITRLGHAYWLNAPASWRWLSNMDGYRRFLDILYEESRPIRKRIQELFWKEYRAYRDSLVKLSSTKH